MDVFERNFPVWLIQFEDEANRVANYNCLIKVTPSEATPEGFRGPKLHNNKLSIAVNQLKDLLASLLTIEMNDPAISELVEPKNGFNKRDFLADLRTMPVGNSKIIGDEYPPNTLNRKPLLVTNGYVVNIDILEIEIALTLMEITKTYNIHPYDVEVILTQLS